MRGKLDDGPSVVDAGCIPPSMDLSSGVVSRENAELHDAVLPHHLLDLRINVGYHGVGLGCLRSVLQRNSASFVGDLAYRVGGLSVA